MQFSAHRFRLFSGERFQVSRDYFGSPFDNSIQLGVLLHYGNRITAVLPCELRIARRGSRGKVEEISLGRRDLAGSRTSLARDDGKRQQRKATAKRQQPK
jgi:hypothetical protein